MRAERGTVGGVIRIGIAGWDYPDWDGIVYPSPPRRGFDRLAWAAGYVDAIEINSSFYRPVQMLTYMADYSLWGNYAFGYHLTNILLHILVALSVYWLVTLLFDDRLLALFTSILFVVHPIHAEVVSYISGRSDSLGMLFLVCAMALYIKRSVRGDALLVVFMTLSYAISLFSRESSLILPVLLLFYHYALDKRIDKKDLLVITGIAVLYVVMRLTVLGHLLDKTSYATTFFERLPNEA